MINCRICSYKTRFYKTVKNITLFKCSNCKIIFQSNIPDDYQKDLYNYYSDFENYKFKDLYQTINSINYKKILNLLKLNLEKKKLPINFIDIGCGYGELVNFGNENGWDSFGIDLSEEAISIGKKHKINIDLIDLTKLDSKKKWSLIFLNEVIEHLINPKELFSNLDQILEKGGIIYLTTPNINSLDRFITNNNWNVFHEEHYFYFSKNSLTKFINNNTNFSIRKIKTRNINIFLYLKKIMKLNKEQAELKNVQYRSKIKNNKFLNLSIFLLNFILNFFSLGNTIETILEKRR